MTPFWLLSWQAVLVILYLGTFVSILAYFLYNHVRSKLPASQVVIIYTSLILVFAALFGWLLLGEDLNCLQSGAILLVLIGVVYSQGMELNQETALTADESL